ncbi:MAG: polysaccharide deacetylase family protein [Candidatus Pacebacteria bacterium]|nr:polysaccharide deacetylase family protein [Candidatus Paceibacterota bacterium]
MKRISVRMLLVMVACGLAFTTVAFAARLPKGIVVFTNDDLQTGSLPVAGVFAGYHFAVTGFPIIDQIGTSGFVTLKQMKNLQKQGWDFQVHAYSDQVHASGYSRISDWDISSDIHSAIVTLQHWGFGRATALAPPLGDYGLGEGNIDTDRLASILREDGIMICRQAYPDGQDIEDSINRIKTFDPLKVKVFSVKQSTVGVNPGSVPDRFYDLIWSAENEGTLIVIATHGSANHPDLSDDYTVSNAVLNSIANYVYRSVKAGKIRVLPLTKAVSLFMSGK